MQLKCKPGDLAIVIKSRYNLGRIVQVEQLATKEEAKRVHESMHPIWKINVPLKYTSMDETKELFMPLCPDEYLQPIRPDPKSEQPRVVTAPKQTTRELEEVECT